jgi:hypothetical protein
VSKPYRPGGAVPEVRFKEIKTDTHEQIRRGLVWLIDAITGLVLIGTVCGVITWVAWVIPAIGRWWS